MASRPSTSTSPTSVTRPISDPTNNALDIAMGFKRKVLLEEFTTESCPNCPRVAGYLHAALENPEYEARSLPPPTT